MDERKKQAIIKKLNGIISIMPDVSAWVAAPEPKRSQARGILLAEQSLETFEKLYKDFEEERQWSEKFSREYIEEEVIFPLLNCVLTHGNIRLLLDTLISQCDKYTEEHTAYVPIEGIHMGVDQLKLGNITLLKMSKKYFDTFTQQVESTLKAAPQEKQEQYLKTWHEWAQPILKGKIVAAYTTIAEPLRTQELAELECAHVLDILRYFIFISGGEHRSNLGLSGEHWYNWSEVVVASSTYVFSINMSAKDSSIFNITQQMLQDMKDAEVFYLLDLNNPANKTDFSDTLLTGIHWVANSLTQVEPANEFLSLASCLETFLSREKTDLGSITNAIAAGVAWVIGRDFADRQRLHKEMKSMYQMRSTVTHGRQEEDLPKKLPILRNTVRVFMQAVVQRREEFRMGGRKALHQWIDEGPIRPTQPENA